MIVLGFPDYRPQAARLATALGVPYREVALHRFPDGESKVTVPAEAGAAHAVLCRSLDRPNDKLIELLLTAHTLRNQGVQRLTLVAPYLCYMRQDIAFHPGEAVSQRIVGRFLGELCDDVITVDPHLHRIERLEQAIPNARCLTLSAAHPLSDHLAWHWQDPLLLGPDRESAQWVAAIARHHGLDWGVAEKHRHGDREVEIELPAGLNIHGRTVVLVDDVASTGQTLAQAAQALRRHGVTSVHALVTHALCSAEDMTRLHAAGVQSLASSDSVSHASNVVELAGLLAEGVRSLG
ncbi:MAG TPA: ribose-phosphate diphosphokinase [Candidatus Competibacteraceae bacterium]|nr:ribose-phosphate diphosphokinase [Candidatus Competibacteraceae bacterium]